MLNEGCTRQLAYTNRSCISSAHKVSAVNFLAEENYGHWWRKPLLEA